MAAKVACDLLHQYLHRHSSCDLAITHSGDPLSFSICQLSAWDSRENYRRFLENYKGQQKGAFDLFLFSLCKAFQVPAVCQIPDFLLPGWLHSSVIFHLTALVFLMSLHLTQFLFPLCHLPSQIHSTRMGEQQSILSPSDAETGYYLAISMSTDHYLPWQVFLSQASVPFQRHLPDPAKL